MHTAVSPGPFLSPILPKSFSRANWKNPNKSKKRTNTRRPMDNRRNHLSVLLLTSLVLGPHLGRGTTILPAARTGTKLLTALAPSLRHPQEGVGLGCSQRALPTH